MREFIIVILLLLFSSGMAQEVQHIVLKIDSDNADEQFHEKIYLMDNDSILAESICNDGIAEFWINPKVVSNDVIVAKRVDKDCIIRIRLNQLKEYGLPLKVSNFGVQCLKDEIEKESENLSNMNMLHDSSLDMKIWTDITKEMQLLCYGEIRCYFPSDALLDKGTAQKEVTDKCYSTRFYHEFGHYPDQRETDSLIALMAKNSAEMLENWYSWELLDLQEPAIFNQYSKEVIRISWNCKKAGYLYDPYSLRMEIEGDSSAILYCSYRKVDEYGKYPLFCDVILLTSEELRRCKYMIENFAVSHKQSVIDISNLFGKDCNLIFESNIDGQYHVIFRGEGEDPALDELQKFLWSLTGLGENKIVHKRQRIE